MHVLEYLLCFDARIVDIEISLRHPKTMMMLRIEWIGETCVAIVCIGGDFVGPTGITRLTGASEY